MQGHESSLLARFATGDASAFAEFYDLCSAKVYGVVLQALSDADLAASVLEEAFMDAWRDAARAHHARVDPEKWVCGLAHARATAVTPLTSAVEADEAGAPAA